MALMSEMKAAAHEYPLTLMWFLFGLGWALLVMVMEVLL